MNFTQIVYYNDKPIILTNDTRLYLTANPDKKDYIHFEGLKKTNFPIVLRQLEDITVTGAIIEESSVTALGSHLKDMYKVIQAGGGLVYNEDNNILMIFRRGKWDLPKGKLDKGETIEQCALREVAEETGVNNLTLGHKICETWHLYLEKGKNYVKHTTWFKMTATGNEALAPQAEEDISEARWVATGQLTPYVSNTYKAIKEVLIMEGFKWQG